MAEEPSTSVEYWLELESLLAMGRAQRIQASMTLATVHTLSTVRQKTTVLEPGILICSRHLRLLRTLRELWPVVASPFCRLERPWHSVTSNPLQG